MAKRTPRVQAPRPSRCLRVTPFVILSIALAIALLWRQLVLYPLVPHPVNLTGRTAIVTGATAGIGFETVRWLASWNATVIMAVRNYDKGMKMATKIAQELKQMEHCSGTVQVKVLDLASFGSVRDFAKEIVTERVEVDMLILNAGMNSFGREKTIDGVELNYQVNVLSHMLLGQLLAPQLALGARVVSTTSVMHYLGDLDREAYNKVARNLRPETMRDGVWRYSDTKLMNVMFAAEYPSRIERADILSVATHPGFVISEIDRHTPGFTHWLVSTARLYLARTTAEGALTQVTAATHPRLPQLVAKTHGVYFEDRCIMWLCDGGTPKSVVTNPDDRAWLWETASEIFHYPPQVPEEA